MGGGKEKQGGTEGPGGLVRPTCRPREKATCNTAKHQKLLKKKEATEKKGQKLKVAGEFDKKPAGGRKKPKGTARLKRQPQSSSTSGPKGTPSEKRAEKVNLVGIGDEKQRKKRPKGEMMRTDEVY